MPRYLLTVEADVFDALGHPLVASLEHYTAISIILSN